MGLHSTNKSTLVKYFFCANRISNPLLIIIIWVITLNFIYLHYAHNSLWITIYLNPPKAEVIYNINKPLPTHNWPPKKIAFLYLTRDYIETPKVYDRFFANDNHKPYYSIYVHPKFPDNITNKQPYVYNNILPKHLIINNTARFTYSLVDASNALFKYALNDKLNKKFVLLSETTIPLYNFNTIYDKLMYNNNNFSWGLQQGTQGKGKCLWQAYNGIKHHAISINGLGMRKREFIRKFMRRKSCLHTTQWIILDRSIIENYLLKYEYYWAQFYKDVHLSFANEDYYSNMLVKFMKSEHEKKSIKPKGVTYYLFRPNEREGHAAYFNNVSNQWIDQLRDDGYLFLRKVNQSSIIDLDYLLRS
eukprot:171616_1